MNRIHTTGDVSASYTRGRTNPFNIDNFARDLQSVLAQDPVVDGFEHAAEPILVRAFAREPEKLGHWFHDLIMEDSDASNTADILRLLARFKPRSSEWRREIVRVALGSRSVEVRDAAIQAVESWAEPELTDLLRLHTETAPWLAEYAAQVMRDLTA